MQSKRLCVAKCPSATDTFLQCNPTKALSCKKNDNPAHEITIYESYLDQCKHLSTQPASDSSACPRTKSSGTTSSPRVAPRPSTNSWDSMMQCGGLSGFRFCLPSPSSSSPTSSHTSQCPGPFSSEASSPSSSEHSSLCNSHLIQPRRRLLVRQITTLRLLCGLGHLQHDDGLQR